MPESDKVVLYGTGSPIVCDLEESLWRAGIEVAAAVKNFPGDDHVLDPSRIVDVQNLTDALRRLPFIVPLFTPANRQHAAEQARSNGLKKAFSLIDPSVAVPRSFEFGPGLYVSSGCSLGAASQLAEFVFINRGVSLGHHARLARFVSVGPGAVVGSLVEVGAGVLIGAGAVVLPKIHIGANAVVGAGAVVTKDVPPHGMVVGNPGRCIKEVAGYGGRSVA